MPTTGEGDISVLHVDAESNFAEMVARILEREDDRFSVETATNAREGLDYLAENHVDCVVSDYDLPGQNGIAFFEAIRTEHSDLPFILYTGKGSEEVASKAISAGVTDYLQKEGGTDQYTLLANRIRNAVEQYRANRRITNNHRINSVVRKVNKALIHATTQTQIDERVCEIISDSKPYQFAWIGEHDTETKTVEPRTAIGIGTESLHTIKITTDESPTGQGPTERAVQNRELEIVKDIVEIPQYKPWRKQAIEQGCRSSAAIPLVYEDTLYGVLTIYADRTHAFDEEEQQLLSNLGETIAHAHHRIDLQRQYVEQYRNLFEEAPVMIVSTQATTDEPIIDDCNRAFTERLGYTRTELQGTSLADHYTKSSADKLLEKGYQQALSGEFVREQRTLVTRDGEEVSTILRASPRRNQNGEIIGTLALYLDITNEQQVQELEQTNALLSTLFDTLPQGILAETESREVLAANQQFFELFELPSSPADVLGADCEEMAEKASEMFVESEGFIERINTLIAEGQSLDSEELALTDGRIFERAHRPIELSTGDGHLWVYQDITERKHRDQDLQTMKRQLEAILENSTTPMFMKEDNGKYIFVNQAYRDLFDLQDEQIVGRTDHDIHSSEMAEEVQQNDMAAIGHEEPVKAEERILVGNEERIFITTKVPIYDTGTRSGSDTPVAMFGVATDISERKNYEQRLQALNQAIRQLLTAETREEVAEIGVKVAKEILNLDANSIHLYDEKESALKPVAASDAVYELVGDPPTFTGDDSIAWRVYEQGDAHALDDIHDDPDRYNPETPIRSGLYLPLDNHGILIAGSPTPAAFDQRDVLLGDILTSNIAIALDQVDRTNQLRDREQELMRQNERLEQFASVISHDLRNPLNVAEGNLELAREEYDSKYLEEISWANERMRTLIDDLLLLAREGDAVTDRKRIELGALIEGCWENVATGDATLTANIDRTIQADESRLKQLFENLYRNAVEHGGENVTVSVGELDDGFYIEDDGPGIPEDDRFEVFEVGYSTSENGTGFGLSIVQDIVTAHDWQIESTAGNDGGARFEITGVEFVE
ncbi:hybrid sensor histidine kinase/response regulator [Natrinema salsiterrestre]|uniref:histidine kinase n=1 Tax=Natrinema salsiterrestre TaxID=2950540 RepID=A0A9Q4L7B5_9EURY|nr:GAF domain-containing protein [Natrinema salsiterrestre]MDF9747882.1 PAS domain-containing protein [Natrinema salsiterrestre]